MQNELTLNTVEWWLNQITDPIIKRLALGNMERSEIKCSEFAFAIDEMTDWNITDEGYYFWAQICDNDPNITFESVKHLLPENYVLTN